MAHLWRILSAAALRWAAVKVRPRFFGSLDASAVAVLSFGGRPLRLVGPCNASIARLSLSRSAISRAMMCSVGIEEMLARGGYGSSYNGDEEPHVDVDLQQAATENRCARF